MNKPAGMVVHPAPGSPNGTFVNALLHHLGDELMEKLLENVNKPTSGAKVNLSLPSTNSGDIESNYDDNTSYGSSEGDDDYVDEYENENEINDVFLEIDDLSSLDLPETPEAANASPQLLRPGIVHRLDKGMLCAQYIFYHQ